MNELEIKQLANHILENDEIESETIEYKKSFDNILWTSILKTVCAYSNNYMEKGTGLIFIGIEETNDKQNKEKAYPIKPITGINPKNIEHLTSSIKQLLFSGHIDPKPRVNIISNTFEGKHYLIIAVDQNRSITRLTEKGINYVKQNLSKFEASKVALKPLPYIRIERDSIAIDYVDSRFMTLLKKFNHYSFMSDYCKEASIDDLDLEVMREFCLRSGKKNYKNLDKNKLAIKLNAFKQFENTSTYYPTNYGVLMFCNRPSRFIKNSGLNIIRKGNGGKKIENITFDDPIWVQVKKMYDYFEDKVVQSVTLKDGGYTSRKVFNYPLETLREIGTNAIYHNDYDDQKHPVEIHIREDQISFINYNNPLPPVTVDQLNNEMFIENRSYLNEELSQDFIMLDYIEKSGSGLETAKLALQNNNSKAIKYTVEEGTGAYTHATIFINEEYKKVAFDGEKVTFEGEKVAFEDKIRTFKLNKTTIERIMKMFDEYGFKEEFGREEIKTLFNISAESTVTKMINSLKNKNIIIKDNGRGKYIFNNDL